MMNEPIARLVKDGVVLYEDYEPVDGCRNLGKTYGEICIQCNLCGRFQDRHVPREEDVREQGYFIEPSEDSGWGYDEDVTQMHYYERDRLAAVCGWIPRPKELYEPDEATLREFRHHFCWSCLQGKE